MRRPGRPIGISWRANARVLAWATDVLTVLMLFVLGTGGMGLVFLLVALGQAWLRAARRNSWGA
jgi:hypothetical protein